MISIFAHTHMLGAHIKGHTNAHTHAHSMANRLLCESVILFRIELGQRRKKAERWWAYTHTHLECEAMEAIFRAFFCWFCTLIRLTMLFWMAIALETPFRNVIPRVCVWRIPSIVSVLVRVFNVSNSTYKYAANASVLFILFYTNAK